MGNVAIFKGKLVKFLAKAGILIPKRPTTDRSGTPEQGETAFNTTDNKLEVWDGSSWTQLSGGGGGGTTGTLIHPSTNSTFEFGAQDNIPVGETYTGWGNTAIGVDAGDSLSSGEFNTLYGYGAGTNLTQGFRNTFIGFSSGQGGSGNVSQAGAFNNNTAVGMRALGALSSGQSNVAIGFSTAYGSLSTGNNNTVISSQQSDLPSGISGIVLIGRDSTASHTNTTTGNARATQDNDFVLGTSLHNYKLPGTVVTYPLTLGFQNEIRFRDADSSNYVGWQAPSSVPLNEIYQLPSVTGTVGQVLSISNIPSIGTTSLSWITPSGGGSSTGTLIHPTPNSTFEYDAWNTTTPMTGSSNTGIGKFALDSATTGSGNTVYGYNAGTRLTTSNFNTIIGGRSGEYITTGGTDSDTTTPGGSNVFVGYNAGFFFNGSDTVAIGKESFNTLQSGIKNVAIGHRSAGGLETGDYNTFINAPAGVISISGAVVIGSDSTGASATPVNNNDFVLGTSAHNYKLPGKVNDGIIIAEQLTTPAIPTADSECKIYMKNDKLVIQFNQAGTVRYKYLDLTGTGVTWVHTTVAP